MKVRSMVPAIALLLLTQHALADDSYEEVTQVTGGSLIDTMKAAGPFSRMFKGMLDPTSTITMIHGNQKAVVSKDHTEIWDLDKEVIIHIDKTKKTYSVLTFAQMRQMFADMPAQMQKMQAQMKQAQANQPAGQPPADMKMTFDAKVKNTGVTKVVNGLTAQEQIITLTMTTTVPTPQGQPADPSMPTSIQYVVTTDAWIAPDPPEIKAIADFDLRMGQKLMQGTDAKALADQMKKMQEQGNAMMMQLTGGKPGMSEAMAQMSKEMAKLKGTRVLEITSVGGIGAVGAAGTGAGPASPAAAAPPAPSGKSVAGQVASDTATQTAAGESGRLGIFGSALSNSALGAFHRKKATPPTATTDASAATSTAAPAPAAAPGVAPQGAVMMATTTQKTNFSQDPVPTSVFDIPAGYKRVDQPGFAGAK